MTQRYMLGVLAGGLLAIGTAAGTLGIDAAAATVQGDKDFQVENHYLRTDLYLPLGSYLATTKEKEGAPTEGCSKITTAAPGTTMTNLFHCPRTYLFVPARKISYLKEVRLRPFALQETEEEESGSYSFVRRIFPQDKTLKKSGTTPAFLTLQVVELASLPAGQRMAKIPARPKVLKTIDKIALKLGQDNAIPVNLALNGPTSVGVLLTVTVDESAKKAQIVYLEATDQSQLWLNKQVPFVYQLLPDGFLPAYSHADVRLVYKQ